MKFNKTGFLKVMGGGITKRISVVGVLVITQILLLSISIVRYAIPLHSYTYHGRDLTAGACRFTTYKGHDLGCYVDMDLLTEASVDPQYIYITTPAVDLPRGSYRVTIDYQTDDANQKYAFTSALNIPSVVVAHDGCRIPMDADRTVQSFSSSVPVDAFEVHLNYSGNGYLFVERITIEETNAWKNIRLFWVLLLSIMIDGFFWWYRKLPMEVCGQVRVTVGILAGVSLFASLPFMSFYLLEGPDLPFHLARIEAIKTSLLHGELPNRISAYWLNGYGYASAIFYGEIFLYIPAVLRILGFTLQGAYKIYAILINLGTVFISYYSFRKVFRDRRAALIGSVAYLLSPYRLVCMYWRGAVGEYTAMMFFPLIFYGLMWIYMDFTEKERYRKSYIPLVLGMSGIIQCHVISFVIAVLFMGIFSLLFIKRTFSLPRFWQMVKAVMGTVLLNIWFLLPFADYMRLGYAGRETIASAPGKMNMSGAYLSQMFTIFQTGAARSYHVIEDMEFINERSYAMGPIAFAAAFYLVYRLHRGRMQSEIAAMGDLSLTFAVLSGFMCTVWFPWNCLQRMNGLFRMVIKNIQFPWRFLGICSFFLVLTTISLFCLLNQESGRHRYRMCFVMLVSLFIISADYYMYDYTYHAEKFLYRDESDVGSYEIGLGEYLPKETPEGYAYEAVSVPGSGVEIIEECRTGGGHRVTCKNNAQEASCIDLPFLPYRGYVCRDQETGEEFPVQLSVPGRLRVVIPQGYDGTLFVHFEEPWYWRGAELVSLLALLGVAVKMILQRKGARVENAVKE